MATQYEQLNVEFETSFETTKSIIQLNFEALEGVLREKFELSEILEGYFKLIEEENIEFEVEKKKRTKEEEFALTLEISEFVSVRGLSEVCSTEDLDEFKNKQLNTRKSQRKLMDSDLVAFDSLMLFYLLLRRAKEVVTEHNWAKMGEILLPLCQKYNEDIIVVPEESDWKALRKTVMSRMDQVAVIGIY